VTRVLTIGAVQLGPIVRAEPRRVIIKRLMELMRQAHVAGCEIVVYPEAALTPFFPHWWIESQAELDSYFETELPGPETRPLFDVAAHLGIGFCLGYAELAIEDGIQRHYNSAILVDRSGRMVGKYRKVHLPGHSQHEPWRPFQNLEKRYFRVGNLGFPVWDAFGGRVGILICNDRRWPEAYRMLGLQGVELILIGYNTPAHNPIAPEQDGLSQFHNHLSMQAGAYQNGTWVVGVAKCGTEEGVHQIGQSVVVAPSGEIVAMATTLHDELVVTRCDLDLCRPYKEKIWDFPANRQPQYYQLICQQS
jgi:N-carbamoyl-D-amino-acid hydrolase